VEFKDDIKVTKNLEMDVRTAAKQNRGKKACSTLKYKKLRRVK